MYSRVYYVLFVMMCGGTVCNTFNFACNIFSSFFSFHITC